MLQNFHCAVQGLLRSSARDLVQNSTRKANKFPRPLHCAGLRTSSASAWSRSMIHQPSTSNHSHLQRLLDFSRQRTQCGNEIGSEDASELRRLLSAVPLEELGFSTKVLQDPFKAFGKPWRLLFGELHVRAYDFVQEEPARAALHQKGTATLVLNRVLKAPCDPLILYANSGGNIHSFEALTPCAVLDVLAPPYDSVRGRPCTYYVDPLPSNACEGETAELRETQADEFAVAQLPFRGVKVL